MTRDAPEATRYVDLVAAESWDLHGDIAVVTVRVVLLEGTEGRWTSVHAARYAVPLSVGALRPAGEPWRLPADPTGDDLPEPVPLDPAEALDPERARALGSAVEAVGYRQVSVEAAGLGPGDLVVVRLRGIAPGEEAESDHHLWLDPTGARVLGSP